MSVIGMGSLYNEVFSRAAAYAKWAGGDKKSPDTATAAAGEAGTASSIVTLSDNAKLASAQASARSFRDVGVSAHAKLKVLIQQAAEKTGTPVLALNIHQAGLLADSSFSNQELAAMALNSSGNFSKEEQVLAQGWLAERMRVSLEAYRGSTMMGDRRGHAMAIDALYEKMSPEVRSALNWTPAMLVANNRMLEGDERRFGKLDIDDILGNLRTVQAHGGLMFE
jgi:hypothetical protein